MSSIDIISRLSTRFDNATGERTKPDYLTRDIGGQFRNNQPYISGYFQIVCGLPSKLFNDKIQEPSQWLHSACESFTPHTQTLNKADIMGQGQVGSSFITSTTITREFTLAFREYQNLPIVNIIKQWSSVMDPFTGVSPLSGNEFIPSNMKGWIAVAQTKPVKAQDANLAAEDIEECYIYNGVFPTNIPLDALSSDITANDFAQLSVTFSFDGAPLTSAEPGVTDKVVNLLENMRYIGTGGQDSSSTYNRYWKASTETQQWVGPDSQEVEGTASVSSGD